jgi:hypothetical protein
MILYRICSYTHSAAGTKTAAGFRSPREGAKKRPANTNGGGGGGGNSEQKSGFFFNCEFNDNFIYLIKM